MTLDTETEAAAPPAEPLDTAQPASPPQTRARDSRQARMAQNFSHVVAVLMRDPSFRNLRLADLEWLVLPPIMAGQFKLGHAPAEQLAPNPNQDNRSPGGMLIPVAVAVWATVSAELDKALSENLDPKLWLRANEWASGDNIWLMAVAGDPRAVPTFLRQLVQTEFAGKKVRMRARTPEGQVTIKALDESV